MDSFLDGLGNIADIIGVISGIVAVVAWVNARKHANKANETLEIIQNYRRVEIFTEVNKKLEQIKRAIRDIATDNRTTNVQKRYKELETTIGEIIHSIPSKNNQLIDKMREVEKEIRVHGDNNQKLVGNAQYAVLDSIDFVTTSLKGLMEELRQEN
ncbi:hypothetical protein CON42_11895 [Bacillus thuringiensis]|uniref:hypothetical protein n=1 Tax=Bacillus cereus group TaxID=86661 RepID=UPI0007FB200D|nr:MULTISPECIES: hypothetical protein [Bacillus cereus group]MCP1399489.1 hypothetical protein [Bacillus cereus]OBW85364.1 hypothetical protein A9L49_28255 [Bacillus cereus]PEA15239.1 hypothetical protein CON42_11895 [Bacillus thuringiensis]PER53177.1 hypothetical protein CN486_23145 [Bacillus thuringiensis]PFF67882.1 hypothetical protein CN334_12595 [Bacillus thuringiensis]